MSSVVSVGLFCPMLCLIGGGLIGRPVPELIFKMVMVLFCMFAVPGEIQAPIGRIL